MDLPSVPRPFEPFNFTIPKSIHEHLAEENYASAFHSKLVEWINDFHASLDDQHEVGARLVTFGQAVTIHIEDLSYYNPSLISFIGTMADSGEPVELIQHVSQISILLVKLPRLNPDEPKRPIGFSQE